MNRIRAHLRHRIRLSLLEGGGHVISQNREKREEGKLESQEIPGGEKANFMKIKLNHQT